MSGMLWRELWFDEAKISNINEILSSGYRIDETGQMRPSRQGGSFTTPWVFHGQCIPTNCGIWNAIYFRRFKLIPKYCRTKCHKVVASARNMKELMQINDLMAYLVQVHNISGKCGCDRRTYTFGAWKAFWYFQSLQSGLEGLDIIREEIARNISPEIKVILKKGCTEFENPRMGGLSADKWGESTEADLELEHRLNSMFFLGEDRYIQPDWLKQKIMLTWFAYAYGMGDITVNEYVTPDFFGVHTITLEKVPKSRKKRTKSARKKALPKPTPEPTKEPQDSINPL